MHSKRIILQWQPPELEYQNGVITEYLVEVSSVNGNVTIFATFSNTTGDVGSLNPYTRYQIRISAATAVGSGPFSEPLNILTNEDGKT